ncbi:MAG: DNRLRE domain-containing protein [bacterium]
MSFVRSDRREFLVRFSLLLLALGVTAMMGVGCGQYNSEVGSSVVGGQVEGVLRDTVIQIRQSQTRIVGDSRKPSAALLFAGEQSGMMADILLKFPSPFLFVDSVLSYHSAKVVLHTYGLVDSAKVTDWTPWQADVLRIDEPFDSSDIDYDYAFVSSTIGFAPIGTPATDDSIEFDIDTTTMHLWEVDSLRNGILLHVNAGAATFLKRFYTYTTSSDSLLPLLKFRAAVIDGDELHPDSLIEMKPSYATYLAHDLTLPTNDQRLYLSNGFERNVLLKADFTSLSPQTASINKVKLYLSLDTTGIYAFGDPGLFTYFQVTTEWDEFPDSLGMLYWTSTAQAVGQGMSQIILDITNLAREWEKNPSSNKGLVLRQVTPGYSLGRAVFYDITSADTTLRPYMRVIYTDYSE